MKTIGLIMSAGNETRFLDDKPKALSIIDGKRLLDINVGILKYYCSDVYVVVNKHNEHFFDNIQTIVIDSGHGCGDAVMKALGSIKSERVMILWGDCVVNRDVVRQCVESFNEVDDIVVPCALEKTPYVRLFGKGCGIRVEFSKYGEVHSEGYHDFGFFYGKTSKILNYLCELANLHRIGNGYKHKHGDEIQFLDVFNETNISGSIVPIHFCEPKSFNTKDELNQLIL